MVGFRFSLAFQNGDGNAAFQEVSGIEKELNVEEVVCGGENQFKYRLPTVTTYKNLILKRGITEKNSELTEWCAKILDGGLINPIVPKNVVVRVLDANGSTCFSWNFVKAYPVKWSTSDLKSQENAMLIESMELAYQYFNIIKMPKGG